MKVYCLIDCQNDFIDGVLGSAAAQRAVPRICKTLWKADHNDMIIMTQDTHYDDYMQTQEGKNLPVEHCKIYSQGWQINDEIEDSTFGFENKKVFMKEAFGSNELGYQIELIEDDIDEIIFMGFCTDICVVSNALFAKMVCPEVPIKVIADCCAGVTPEKHEAALEVMRSCQIEVI